MDCDKKPNTSRERISLQGENKERGRKKQSKESKSKRNRPPKQKRINPTWTQTEIRDMTSTEKKCATQQTSINISDKHISQQIQVEKQEFKCIINLNTTICEHKSNHRKTCDKKHRSTHTHTFEKEKQKSKRSKSSHTIRDKHSLVPKCFRRDCVNSTFNKKRRRLEESERNAEKLNDKRTFSRDNPKKSKCVHKKNRDSDHKDNKNNPKILMSPISSSPLHDNFLDNLTYEDISSTSLETDLQKPMSRKRGKHHKHTKEVSHESKLDTLIRRTKERERQLVEQFRIRSIRPWYTSTPIRNDFGSGDIQMSGSDMDISFNSRSTFVLETRSLPYSPSCPIEDMNRSLETEKFSYSGYTPSSPSNKDYTLKDKSMNIKNEPTMNIEAYSPTCSPDKLKPKLCDLPKIRVKKEVETEHLFSPGMSPIYYEDNNNGLEFCKIDSIKREIDNDG